MTEILITTLTPGTRFYFRNDPGTIFTHIRQLTKKSGRISGILARDYSRLKCSYILSLIHI